MTDAGSTSPAPVRASLLEQGLVLLVAAVFYGLTVSRVIGSGDTALLVDGIADLTISTHVNNHNLTVVTGWLVSHLPGSRAFLANFTSTVLGVVAIGLFWRALASVFRSRLTVWVTTLAVVVSHSMWWHSTTAEVYAANAVLVSAALWLLARYQREGDARTVLGLFVVSGFAFFNHVQLGIIGVAATWLMAVRFFVETPREQRSLPAGLRWFLTCSAWFLVGFLPYLLTFVKDARASGSWQRTLKAATGGDFQTLMFKGTFWDGLRETAYLLWMQFPTPFLACVLAGAYFAWKRWGWRRSLPGLAGMFAVNTHFFMHFNTWDRFAFLLPSFLSLAFVGAFAVDEAVTFVRAPARPVWWRALGAAAVVSIVIVPPWLYANLARWGSDSRSVWYDRYSNRYSWHLYDHASYVTNPDKHDYREFDTFGRALFDKLPPNAIFFDDDSRAYYQLKYFQRFEKLRPDVDVRVVNSWGFSNWGDSPDAFVLWLERAHGRNLPLFLATTGVPFDGFLRHATEVRRSRVQRGLPPLPEFRFVPFTFREGKWVYRLVTASEAGAPILASIASVLPQGLDVGRGFDRGAPELLTEFASGSAVMARFRTVPNAMPYDIVFAWSDASGRVVHRSAPFLVATGNTDVWSYLEPPAPQTPGDWRVAVLVDGREAALAKFTVTAAR